MPPSPTTAGWQILRKGTLCGDPNSQVLVRRDHADALVRPQLCQRKERNAIFTENFRRGQDVTGSGDLYAAKNDNSFGFTGAEFELKGERAGNFYSHRGRLLDRLEKTM